MGQNVLRGTFVDSITGAPLPFVNAVYDEAGHGVTADLNGRFELTTVVPVERIIVSYVGYKPAIFTISESMRQQEARYPLRQQHVDIEAVYVTSAENPAVLLLRRALAKRSLHSPRALPGYRFISYNKMLVTIRDTATSNVDNGPFPHERDADATTHYLIINETVSRHFYRRPNTSVDSVISTRTSGLRRKSLPIVAGSMQSISFYNEDLTLLGSKYVNPFSPGGLMHYSYTLQDTMVGQGGDSVVAVRFQPKRTSHSSALSGVLYIAIGEYSLRNVIAYSSMDDRSGTFHIAQNYRRKGSHTWFPAELRTKVVMTGSDLYITNETHISDITIDTVVRERVSLPLTSIVLAEADGLTVERTLDQYRATPLNYTELNTYRVTDSLSDTYKFENWADLATDFLDGYLWLKYVKLDLLSLLDYNSFEGFRLGVALETTSLFSSRFRLGGTYAYGFADREHKYGARIGARVWPQRDGWLDVRYSHDVATPGQPSFDEDRRGIAGSFYVRRMDYRSGAHLSLQGYISRKWQATLSVGYHRYTNLAGYGIPQVQDGGIYVAGADDYTLLTPRISLRFYPNLPLVQYPDGVRPLLSSPVRFFVHLQQGFEPIHRRARYTKLDPNTGARLALAEAYRNVAVTGATPVAVTNCLNFGSPENPDVMWQFREAVHGLADGCAELGIPVSGGNVSFYNQTGTEPILPTPVVGVLGVINDVAERIGHTLGTVDGPEDLYVLGATFDEFGGSIWQQVSGGGLNGMPPAVDLANEQKLVELFSGPRVVTAAHDVSEGGLAQAVAELAMTSGDGVGVDIDVAAVHEDPFVALFSESASRAVVATTDGAALEGRARELGIPCVKLGRTNTDKQLRVAGQFDVPVAELREAWAGTLPEIFGHAVGANSVVE